MKNYSLESSRNCKELENNENNSVIMENSSIIMCIKYWNKNNGKQLE